MNLLPNSTHFRIILLGTVIVGAFAALLVRLYVLQIDRKDEFVAKLPGTREVLHRLPGTRGRILDVNGVELARDRTLNQINLDLGEIYRNFRATRKAEEIPKYTRDSVSKPEVDMAKVVRLAVINPMREMGVEVDINEKTEEALRRHWREFLGQTPFEFKRDVPWEIWAAIAERSHTLPGVTVSQRAIREYPFGALGGCLLGYVKLYDKGRDDPDRQGYKFFEGDDYGQSALEKTLDPHLRGKAGYRKLLINEHGRLDRVLKVQEPGNGDDVYLTLDIRAQYIAEMALREGGVGRGAAVVMDPNTGAVLAMATVPNYNPNNFIPSITPADYAVYREDDTHPLVNRAIRGYAPGSTFKIPVALAGFLAPGKMRSHYHCSNYVSYGTYNAPCWTVQKGMGGHGSLDIVGAIKNSCNCFFYQYGNDAGILNVVKMGEMLGLGTRTGLEIGEEEERGVVPGPVYHRAVGKAKFTDALTAQTSIGQYDTLASPLQMCAVQATVANGGISYVPTFVHHRWDPLTNKSTSFTPKIRANLLENGVKKSQIDKIRRGEWEVVNAQGGTGSRYRSSLPIIKDNGGGAGKTGTAQFKRAGQKDNHTWFIGFAPFDKPKLAVCVLVQGGNAGGTCAAPVAKRITERILMLQSGQYEIDPSGIRNVKEAKGHFKYIDAVTYSDENPADIEPVQDDVDSDESEAREVEVAPAKPKNTSAEPTFRTETDSQIQRARVIEKPKFIPNKQSQP